MEGWASQLARMGQEEAGKLEIPWSSVWDVQDDDRWWWAEGGTTGLNCDGLQVCRALVAFQATTRIERSPAKARAVRCSTSSHRSDKRAMSADVPSFLFAGSFSGLRSDASSGGKVGK